MRLQVQNKLKMFFECQTIELLCGRGIMRFIDALCKKSISSKSYCIACAFMFYGSLLAIGLLNFVVDPLSYFGTKLFAPSIQLTRNVKADGIAKAPPGTSLILGSSRVLKIEPNYLSEVTGDHFYNAGVNYGKPEDFYALLNHYQSIHQSLPRKVIIGLDVVAFNASLQVENELLSSRTLARYLPTHIATSSNSPFNHLFGLQKTRLSLACIKRAITGRAPIDIQNFRDDGVIVYQSRESQRKTSTYDFSSALQSSIDEYEHHFRDYERICPNRWNLFVESIEMLRSNGCDVVVFLTPDHPDLRSRLSCCPNYNSRSSDLHDMVTKLSSDTGVKYFNLQSIDHFGGDVTEFIDGIHPLEQNTRRLVRKMLKSEEDDDVIQ